MCWERPAGGINTISCTALKSSPVSPLNQRFRDVRWEHDHKGIWSFVVHILLLCLLLLRFGPQGHRSVGFVWKEYDRVNSLTVKLLIEKTNLDNLHQISCVLVFWLCTWTKRFTLTRDIKNMQASPYVSQVGRPSGPQRARRHVDEPWAIAASPRFYPMETFCFDVLVSIRIPPGRPRPSAVLVCVSVCQERSAALHAGFTGCEHWSAPAGTLPPHLAPSTHARRAKLQPWPSIRASETEQNVCSHRPRRPQTLETSDLHFRVLCPDKTVPEDSFWHVKLHGFCPRSRPSVSLTQQTRNHLTRQCDANNFSLSYLSPSVMSHKIMTTHRSLTWLPWWLPVGGICQTAGELSVLENVEW